MRIGLFGGSFDPFHNGHLAMVKGAIKSGSVDAVIVIPSVRNSFKRGRSLSAAPYRYYMTKAALEKELPSLPAFISDIEYSYDGISYTATTIRLISNPDYIVPFLLENGIKKKKATEEHEYYWIVGSDILPSFDKWYKPDEIVRMATLLVASRPADGVDLHEEVRRLTNKLGCEIKTFDYKETEVASSSLRVNRDFNNNVPSVVDEFIKTHALYKEDVLQECSEEAADKFLDIAADLYSVLGEKRLLHTINVGLLSCHYALIHGVSPDKALIAGILHDCAKELPLDTQREMANMRADGVFEDKKLLHSPAGAIYANEKWGIDDEEILEAITYHTTGFGDMTMLDKIVFLSDKLEPARTYTDLTEMRSLAEKDIDASLRLCVGAVRAKFESQGRDIHPLTLAFMESLGV